MAFITKDELKRAAGNVRLQKSNKTFDAILKEEVAAASRNNSFDVFLSHSFKDKELVIGAKNKIEAEGLSVYIDWIDDEELDRTKVSPVTANRLRTRMRQCRSMVYAHTVNTGESKWCPWELGYFDAFCQKVFILPVTSRRDEKFTLQEYVGLYPYLEDVGELKVIPINESNTVTARLTRDTLKKAVHS